MQNQQYLLNSDTNSHDFFYQLAYLVKKKKKKNDKFWSFRIQKQLLASREEDTVDSGINVAVRYEALSLLTL